MPIPQVTYLNGSKRVASPCIQSGTWSHFIHAQYLNCATFDLKEKLRHFAKTVEIYLYLHENMAATICPDCFHGDVKSQLSGAIIAIHKPETFPNINDKSINLKPGSLTEIMVRTTQNLQKSPPYGRCSKDTPDQIEIYNKMYTYSEHACRQNAIQSDINENCSCVAIEYPYNNVSQPFCSRLASFIHTNRCVSPSQKAKNVTLEPECVQEMENALKYILCKTNITEKYNQDVVHTCTIPCSFYSYDSDRSTSTWPTKSWQLRWLGQKMNRLSGFFNYPEFKPYHEAMNLFYNNRSEEAHKILERTDVLERNLLAVLINRPNFHLFKVEEKEVLSLTSFLSQAGGLFSIWMGLTMISIVEIIELVIHCFYAMHQRTKSRGNGSSSSSAKKKRRRNGAGNRGVCIHGNNGDLTPTGEFKCPHSHGYTRNSLEEARGGPTESFLANNYAINEYSDFSKFEQQNIETVL